MTESNSGNSSASNSALTEIDLRFMDAAARPPNPNSLLASHVRELVTECRRLRQGLFECFRIAGGDTDGDKGPEAWMGDIVERVTRVVADLRINYDEDANALDQEIDLAGGSLKAKA